MQSHNGMDYPDLTEYEKSIQAFIAEGVKVQFTELDLNVLPNPEGFHGASIEQNDLYKAKLDPYKNGMPKKTQKAFTDRYLSFFKLYLKYAPHVERVTFWGVYDKTSWLNDWPIVGRTNYPLFFDRNYQPKPVVKEVIKLFTQSDKNDKKAK